MFSCLTKSTSALTQKWLVKFQSYADLAKSDERNGNSLPTKWLAYEVAEAAHENEPRLASLVVTVGDELVKHPNLT